MLRIYINREPVVGPWGGGSKVLSAIIHELRHGGHEVVHEMCDDVSAILCVDPRPGPKPELWGYGNIRSALLQKRFNGTPKLIQRVGDLGLHGKPDLTQMVMGSVLHADTVVFPSRWAHDIVQFSLEQHGLRPNVQWHVIPNSALSVFFSQRNVSTTMGDRPSLVTHHWSTNAKKGFAFYHELSRRDDIKFTYIGRHPEGMLTQIETLPSGVVKVIPPASGAQILGPFSQEELAKELPKHDVYVTASIEEAGANHVLEALACGLPVIYHQEGGSIGEYVGQLGVSFDGTMASFDAALRQVRDNYPKFRQLLGRYKRTMDDTAVMYRRLIEGTCGV